MPQMYNVVSKRWRRMITGLVLFGIACLLFLSWNLWVLTHKMQTVEEINALTKERNKALNEMILNRGEIQIFSYNKACAFAKAQGELCLQQPSFYLKRDKYPLLSKDPDSQYLFEKEAEK